ncbi:poly-gamma-glutamate biosynthesis protein PgsC [candidate division KSB1 bacterium 4572_119]|nr:MAG: poly-gamma-glutamate biosynthesis protein PgsC [candidate division KSB1 bacterium 4572_119]
MIAEAIFIGIILGLIYYEIVGLTPGGVIVPGYIALYLTRPLILLTTFIAVMLTLFLVKLLSRLMILYGRRAFVASVIIGFLLKWSFETLVLKVDWISADLTVIGFIIPGLIANEMRKQGVWQTVYSCAAVSALVAILLKIHEHFLL